MIVYYHPDCLLHDPPYEILSGKLVPYFESPSRIERIEQALREDPKFTITDQLDELVNIEDYILKIHDADYLDYLKTIHEQWVEEGGDPTAVIPETFGHIALISKKPKDIKFLPANAKAGLYCFDLSCPITKDSYKAILTSLRVTLSAANRLMALKRDEQNGIFALCRPPGHHSARSVCGGYCFLNNAAIAAKFVQETAKAQGLAIPLVAILDIDYHHGNGTQDIFYTDNSVFYVSLHAEHDYPYFTGAKSEVGDEDGKGFTVNFPLPKGLTGDAEYCDTLKEAVQLVKNFEPSYLIISLGVDTYLEDPICDFKVTTEGYRKIGNIIASVKRPTLFVMEGGYHVETIGANVRNVLTGFERMMEAI